MLIRIYEKRINVSFTGGTPTPPSKKVINIIYPNMLFHFKL